MLQDSPDRYGWMTRLLHWSMAVLVLLQFTKFGDRVGDGDNWFSSTIGPWHTSIGTLLLVLVVVRVGWALSQARRRPRHDPSTALFVKAGHALLYAGLLALPILGVLVLVGGGYGHAPFGIGLIAEGAEVAWARVLGSLHSPLAWLLAIAALAHAGIALYHHFVVRDRTLRRML